MRALAFTDIHGRWDVLRRIVNTDADVYICLGDLTYSERGLEEARKIMDNILDRLIVVPGNNERPETLRMFFPKVLHASRMRMGNIAIAGMGGSPRTPFHTIHEWDEVWAYDALKRIGRVDILLTHAPPAQTELAMTGAGIDAGSEAIRRYIEEYRPHLVLCGHIHENSGKESRIGSTRIINPGPRGRVIDIG